MPHLRYSSAPERDLAGILAYSLRNWGEAQAERYLAALEAACQRIADGTAIARRLDFRNDEMWSLRQGRRLIIHQRRDDSVLIVRILHERMNVEARLRDNGWG